MSHSRLARAITSRHSIGSPWISRRCCPAPGFLDFRLPTTCARPRGEPWVRPRSGGRSGGRTSDAKERRRDQPAGRLWPWPNACCLGAGKHGSDQAAAAVQCPLAATYAATAGCFLCQAQDLVDTAKALPAQKRVVVQGKGRAAPIPPHLGVPTSNPPQPPPLPRASTLTFLIPLLSLQLQLQVQRSIIPRPTKPTRSLLFIIFPPAFFLHEHPRASKSGAKPQKLTQYRSARSR